jgi:hypothetical protein
MSDAMTMAISTGTIQTAVMMMPQGRVGGGAASTVMAVIALLMGSTG